MQSYIPKHTHINPRSSTDMLHTSINKDVKKCQKITQIRCSRHCSKKDWSIFLADAAKFIPLVALQGCLLRYGCCSPSSSVVKPKQKSILHRKFQLVNRGPPAVFMSISCNLYDLRNFTFTSALPLDKDRTKDLTCMRKVLVLLNIFQDSIRAGDTDRASGSWLVRCLLFSLRMAIRASKHEAIVF